ncbi:MAG: recombination protein O N-terminal domain-containing protein [Candidatus Liptonbacteria bacterium]|nr:recombination protein O N-terminal domain-containing protein [Candidatus Liptonbacteria bacterium]
MQEYAGEAVVLRREPHGEQDSRVSLFTKRYGKLTAKAKSARKITSKLSPHLEPGLVTDIRLVEKNDMLVTDALKREKLALPPSTLFSLDRVLAEAVPEEELWSMIRNGDFSWRAALGELGWDPREAACAVCAASPEAFHAGRQEFFCSSCAMKMKVGDLIVLG